MTPIWWENASFALHECERHEDWRPYAAWLEWAAPRVLKYVDEHRVNDPETDEHWLLVLDFAYAAMRLADWRLVQLPTEVATAVKRFEGLARSRGLEIRPREPPKSRFEEFLRTIGKEER